MILPTGDTADQRRLLATGRARTTRSSCRRWSGSPASRRTSTATAQYTRFQAGGGASPVHHRQLAVQAIGCSATPRAAVPRHRSPAAAPAPPPKKPNVPCYKQQIAEPQRRDDRSRAVKRQIRKHLRDFVAIIVPVRRRRSRGGYILSNAALLPAAWVPLVGTTSTRSTPSSPTAQAVVPGQGQTVNIAGVQGRRRRRREARERHRRRDDEIKNKYEPIYHDASSCCARRPA